MSKQHDKTNTLRANPRWDHFAQKAKDKGFASRAVFKLQDIDRRFRLFTPGQRVLDLGCAPGGWLKYAALRVGATGRVVGIDRFATPAPAPQATTIAADLHEVPGLGEEGRPFDVVLSDMAPDTTGIRHVDQDRSAVLARLALDWASRWGKRGSAFVVKLFQGPDFHAFLAETKRLYGKVKCVKPEASRKESIEIYIVAQDKKEGPSAPDPSNPS